LFTFIFRVKINKQNFINFAISLSRFF